MQKNAVVPDSPHMTIWRMRIACWITKDTNTPSEYVIILAFPLQEWLQDRNSMFGYTYTACPVESSAAVNLRSPSFWDVAQRHWPGGIGQLPADGAQHPTPHFTLFSFINIHRQPLKCE